MQNLFRLICPVRCVFILCCAVGLTTLNAQAEQRLVGAKRVTHNDYDWVAAIYQSAFSYAQPCTGVLIKERWVLTTANCVRDNLPRELTVVLGRNDLLSTKGETHRVTRVVANSQYLNSFKPDMALLELSRPSSIEAVEMLPSTIDIQPGKNLLLTGFGIGDSNSLRLKRKVLVRTINPRQCNLQNVLCAGSRTGRFGASTHDQGTPVLVKHQKKWKLAGLVNNLLFSEYYTWERAPWPQNYLDLSSQREWIDRQLTDNSIAGETTDLMSREAIADIYCYELRCDVDARRSTDGRVGIIDHNWDFGDGVTRQGAVVTHKYESPGRYSIELSNQLVDGTTTTRTRSVQVRNRKVLKGRERSVRFRGYASPGFDSIFTFPFSLTEGLYVYKGPVTITLKKDRQSANVPLALRIERYDIATQQWSKLATDEQPVKINGGIRLFLKRSGFLKFIVSTKENSTTNQSSSYSEFELRVKATVSKDQCQPSYECSGRIYNNVSSTVEF